MSLTGQTAPHPDGALAAAHGRRLEYLTIAWNMFEAAVSLVSAYVAGSVALAGFGFDSLIESGSACILLWRLRAQHDPARRERAETLARKLVGGSFLLLSAYVLINAVRALWLRSAPERSWPGILIAAAAAGVMPWLGRAKRRVAAQLGSRALQSDSRQADFCAYLSVILLVGLLLNAALGWWWADPVAGLIMVLIIANEGAMGWRNRSCDDCGH